jgi:hypothetical protein
MVSSRGISDSDFEKMQSAPRISGGSERRCCVARRRIRNTVNLRLCRIHVNTLVHADLRIYVYAGVECSYVFLRARVYITHALFQLHFMLDSDHNANSKTHFCSLGIV